MRNLFYFLLITFFISCGQKQEIKQDAQQEKKPLLSIVKTHAKIIPVKSAFKSKLNEWKEYQNLSEFIKQFAQTSSNEALSNSKELKDLIKSVIDSVKPKILETPAFNARVHVLYNEGLRLADMSKISAIKAPEVNAQIDKVLVAFSSLNKKINTVFSQKKFEEQLFDENINIDESFIRLDTTKIDSVSKKNILTVEEELFKKDIKPTLLKKKKLLNDRRKIIKNRRKLMPKNKKEFN